MTFLHTAHTTPHHPHAHVIEIEEVLDSSDEEGGEQQEERMPSKTEEGGGRRRGKAGRMVSCLVKVKG